VGAPVVVLDVRLGGFRVQLQPQRVKAQNEIGLLDFRPPVPGKGGADARLRVFRRIIHGAGRTAMLLPAGTLQNERGRIVGEIVVRTNRVIPFRDKLIGTDQVAEVETALRVELAAPVKHRGDLVGQHEKRPVAGVVGELNRGQSDPTVDVQFMPPRAGRAIDAFVVAFESEQGSGQVLAARLRPGGRQRAEPVLQDGTREFRPEFQQRTEEIKIGIPELIPVPADGRHAQRTAYRSGRVEVGQKLVLKELQQIAPSFGEFGDRQGGTPQFRPFPLVVPAQFGGRQGRKFAIHRHLKGELQRVSGDK